MAACEESPWRKSIGPTIEFLTYTVATLGQAGERSGQALSRLRRRREEVREGLSTDQRELAPKISAAETKTEKDKRKRRFDVGGDVDATPEVGDIRKALGAARPDESPKKKEPPKKDADEADEGDVTSRLLSAKRRARRDMRDDN